MYCWIDANFNFTWPFDPYIYMCNVGGGALMSSNTQSNLIAPYYWEYISVPMCLTQTHWYSLSRSYSTSIRRGRCRTEKGGTYSCLLLTIPYPTCEGWCQATTLVMHNTEVQTASGVFVSACMLFFLQCILNTWAVTSFYFMRLFIHVNLGPKPLFILASKSYNTNKTNKTHVFHLQ